MKRSKRFGGEYSIRMVLMDDVVTLRKVFNAYASASFLFITLWNFL